MKFFRGAGRREFLLRSFVPFLMVLIFLNHYRLVQWKGLWPWKGGGFGMFSTLSRPLIQGRKVDSKGNTQQIAIRVPKMTFRSYSDEIWSKARAYPSKANLRAAVESLKGVKLQPFQLRPGATTETLQTIPNPVDFGEFLGKGNRLMADFSAENEGEESLDTFAVDIWKVRTRLAPDKVSFWYELSASSI
jgi:hypothetical protein